MVTVLVSENFELSQYCFLFFQSTELSVFETNIRFVAGLLTAYAFTGDKVLY